MKAVKLNKIGNDIRDDSLVINNEKQIAKIIVNQIIDDFKLLKEH